MERIFTVVNMMHNLINYKLLGNVYTLYPKLITITCFMLQLTRILRKLTVLGKFVYLPSIYYGWVKDIWGDVYNRIQVNNKITD